MSRSGGHSSKRFKPDAEGKKTKSVPETNEEEEESQAVTVISNRYYPIWKKIFQYLPTKALLNSRLVCTSWNQLLLSLVREDVKKTVSLNNDHHFKTIQEMARMFQDKQDMPLSLFNFESDTCERESFTKTQQDTLCEFFAASGPFIQSLTVDMLCIKMWSLVKEKCFNFATLNWLEIVQMEGVNRKIILNSTITNKRISEYFKTVVNGAPNLKRLTLSDFGELSTDEDESDHIFTILKELPCLSHLKTLELELSNQKQFAQTANSLTKLQLHDLDLSLNLGEVFSPDTLKSILYSQRNFLEQLQMTIFKVKTLDDVQFRFPRMSALESLHLTYSEDTEEELEENPVDEKLLSFGDISYDSHFPVLRTLKLDLRSKNQESENVIEKFFSIIIKPVASVQEIQLPSCPRFDMQMFVHVAFLFPKLKKLELSSHLALEDIFNSVRMMQELRSLTINLYYGMLEHELDVCQPCVIGKKMLKDPVDEENYNEDREESQIRVRLLLHQIKKLKLQNLNHIRMTCCKVKGYLHLVSIIIQVKTSGDFYTTIQVKQGENENEVYWAEL